MWGALELDSSQWLLKCHKHLRSHWVKLHNRLNYLLGYNFFLKGQLFYTKKHAIDCEVGYGPTFGAGHDLHTSGNAIINYHTILGCSYQCPAGQNTKTFLAGEKHFTVTDYEMFGLHR